MKNNQEQGKFGLPSIILLGVNMVIGTGIFLMPGKAYRILGTPVLLIYVSSADRSGGAAAGYSGFPGIYKDISLHADPAAG